MDLVTFQFHAGKSFQYAGHRLKLSSYPCPGFFRFKNGVHGQQSHAFDGASGFHPHGIAEGVAQHLVPSADAEDHRTGRGGFQYGRFHAGLSHPQQILHSIFRPRKDNHVRMFQFGQMTDVSK